MPDTSRPPLECGGLVYPEPACRRRASKGRRFHARSQTLSLTLKRKSLRDEPSVFCPSAFTAPLLYQNAQPPPRVSEVCRVSAPSPSLLLLDARPESIQAPRDET